MTCQSRYRHRQAQQGCDRARRGAQAAQSATVAAGRPAEHGADPCRRSRPAGLGVDHPLRDETAARDKLAGDLASAERRIEGSPSSRIASDGASRISAERDKLATGQRIAGDKARWRRVTDLTAAQRSRRASWPRP
jgi:hypothetical protein